MQSTNLVSSFNITTNMH